MSTEEIILLSIAGIAVAIFVVVLTGDTWDWPDED